MHEELKPNLKNSSVHEEELKLHYKYFSTAALLLEEVYHE